MVIIEKIYLTWLILALPVALCSWIVFFDNLNEDSIFFKIITVFIGLPLVIGFVAWIIWGIIQIWQG